MRSAGNAPLTVGVAVVGAGPAGLAAAVAAADAGATVVVVDLGQRPGGQYLRQPTVAGVPAVAHSSRADGLLRAALANPRITFRTRSQVWAGSIADRPSVGGRAAGDDGPDRVTLRLIGPDGPVTLTTPVLVLAPGGHDRVVPFPGWDLPGVVTAGAAQALV
ncbi:FAD-dependent oxidoreductase, partial [Plantactinospora sp. S1510]